MGLIASLTGWFKPMAVVLLIASGAGGAFYAVTINARLKTMQGRIDAATAQLISCNARIELIRKDIARDAKIDALDLGGLRAAASRWLREAPAGR